MDYGASLLNAPNSPVLRMARLPRIVLPGVDRSRSPGYPFGTPGSTNLLHVVTLTGDELKGREG